MTYEIMKQTDEIRVDTEEQAESLLNTFKEKAREEGYEIASYKMTKKNKKSKGEIIDEWVVLTIVKVWS